MVAHKWRNVEIEKVHVVNGIGIWKDNRRKVPKAHLLLDRATLGDVAVAGIRKVGCVFFGTGLGRVRFSLVVLGLAPRTGRSRSRGRGGAGGGLTRRDFALLELVGGIALRSLGEYHEECKVERKYVCCPNSNIP